MGRWLMEVVCQLAALVPHTPMHIRSLFETPLADHREAEGSSREDCTGSWPGRAIRPAAEAYAHLGTAAKAATGLVLGLLHLVPAEFAKAPVRVHWTTACRFHTPAWLWPSFLKYVDAYYFVYLQAGAVLATYRSGPSVLQESVSH